ncbi:tape measure protein [Glutamicibacter sp. AOP12-B1-11]|uniref:tape measure protein n=1 Tax=Glutamicibacter sp. AOP12-B1-11 TaxID=3457725 RepID=UPI0040335176
MAIELASAYLSLIPSLKGSGRTISAELGGINLAPVGAKMGAGLSKGIGSSMKANISAAIVAPVTKALESQAGATRDLGSAEMALTKARAGQQSAQAKVARAEEKLEALRDTGTATSAELKGAEAELNSAKVTLAETNVKVGNAEDTATRAKESATAANQAYVDSLKQSSTFTGKLQTALPVIGDQIKNVGGQWKTAGQNISGVGKSMTTKFTAPVVAAGTAVGGLVAGLGFKRLVGIDTARGQFKGLGYDADEVMKQVDKGVTGTALSMADGASMAVGILATGAVPMEELENQIQRTANVAAAYGVEGSHAANLLNAVLTKNKVTYGDLSQMQANGIPIISQLADHYGVAGDEIEKMAREGSISIEDMNKVIDQNAGAAAEEYAKTWKGVTANITSNLGKFGASVFEEVFPKVKSELENFLQVLKSPELKEFGVNLGSQIGDAFTNISSAIQGAIGWWNGLSPAVQKFIGTAAGVVLVAGPILMIVGKIVMTIGGLITAFGSIVSAVGAAIPVLKALNVVMRANVFGIVVTAIAALVAGLIWFFTQTEIGQQIWAGFMGFLQDAWANIVVVFQTSLASISALWTTVWTAVSTFFVGVWNAIVVAVQTAIAFVQSIIAAVTSAISAAWSATWNAIKTVLGAIWAGIVAVVTGYINVVRAVISTVVNAIKVAWNAVWNGIKAFFGAVWAGIVAFVTGYINTVRTIITTVVNAIKAVWTNVWNAIKSFFSSVWNGIISFSTSAVNKVRNVITNVVNAIRSVWNSVWSGISSFFSNIWSNIVSAAQSFMGSVQDKFRAVVDFVKGIPDKVVGFFSGLGGKLVASGKSIIQGFLDGILAGFNKAKSAVSDGLGKIRNLFPFSPAKEGPFSGRGWVAYSGLSIGETFSQSVAGALHDGRKDIHDEMGGIQSEIDSLNEPTFSVGSAVPAFGDDPYGSDGSGAGVRQIVLQVENLTVDDEDRVTELSQALWSRANNADRSRGSVNLGGVAV